MKFSIVGTLFVLIFLASSTQANNDLLGIDSDYLECNFIYENNGDLNRLESCTSLALGDLNQVVIDERNRVGSLKNEGWRAINNSLNKHLELCESNALRSQKNSTIKKDILSCQFFHLRSLAYEASLIN